MTQNGELTGEALDLQEEIQARFASGSDALQRLLFVNSTDNKAVLWQEVGMVVAIDTQSNPTVVGVLLPTPEAIIEAVAEVTRITPSAITGELRDQGVIAARHTAMYLIRDYLDMSYPQIGRVFGRDHTTVVSARKAQTQRLKEERQAGTTHIPGNRNYITDEARRLLADRVADDRNLILSTHETILTTAVSKDGLFRYMTTGISRDRARALQVSKEQPALHYNTRTVTPELLATFGTIALALLDSTSPFFGEH